VLVDHLERLELPRDVGLAVLPGSPAEPAEQGERDRGDDDLLGAATGR
jgi:hypothetical protein